MGQILKSQICVVGGGSGGFAAALRAAQSGCRTILVEKEQILGGNSTVCGVNCWEPVAGAAFGLPSELYKEMSRIPLGCGIYSNAKHFCCDDPAKKDFPGGLFTINPSLDYKDTLKRDYIYGAPYTYNLHHWNGVIFEPRVLHKCIMKMLREAGCKVITAHACSEVICHDGHIDSILLDDGTQIRSDVWIDNCGILASSASCGLFMGQDPAALYHEADAPETGGISRLNGVTLIFRVTPVKREKIEFSDIAPRHGVMVANQYPNGDYNCNMLPTMNGSVYFSMDKESAMVEMRHRVRSFWRYVQENYTWGRQFKIKEICAHPGIRESFRIECSYMLNENDLLAGLKEQNHPDLIVTADHLMDLHGAKNPGRIVYPYGIPYRSLLPVNTDNLLIAGRIGGYSCLAASSCRLSRTVIRLGEGAGFAAALALQEKKALHRINIKKLQEKMFFKDEISVLKIQKY